MNYRPEEIFLSDSLDPYYNLSLEDYFLRSPEFFGKKILLIWRSTPAIIMGRFQNPWLEIDLKKAKNDDVLICRRQSGGGTVYHDEGNLNFCFIGKTKKEDHFNYFLSELSQLGIDLEVNERNDILYKNKKISGSAFKNTKDNSFHHFTFLVDTNLKALKKYLHHKQLSISSKSIPSKRSEVIDLKGVLTVKAILNHFGARKYTPLIEKKFGSDQWIYEETPKFHIKISGLEGEETIEIPKGTSYDIVMRKLNLE